MSLPAKNASTVLVFVGSSAKSKPPWEKMPPSFISILSPWHQGQLAGAFFGGLFFCAARARGSRRRMTRRFASRRSSAHAVLPGLGDGLAEGRIDDRQSRVVDDRVQRFLARLDEGELEQGHAQVLLARIRRFRALVET